MIQTLVIGLGNTVLSDDGAGPATLELLRPRLKHLAHVTCKELAVGGLHLMEEMIGYERVFIVDAMVTRKHSCGTVESVSVKDLPLSRNLACLHDMGLAAALELGRVLNLCIPKDIRIWGIEAEDVDTFREGLTDSVARGTVEAAREILTAMGVQDDLQGAK